MDEIDLQHITGRRKAAALLISLGPELASQVLKTMREDEVETITREIVQMERLPAEKRDAILQQVYEMWAGSVTGVTSIVLLGPSSPMPSLLSG